MLRSTRARKILAVVGISVGCLGAAYFYAITPHHTTSETPESAEGLLDRADALSWGNRWVEARPIFVRAAQLFAAKHNSSAELYARVSELPADESVSAPVNLLLLDEDLNRPEAEEPATRLRILTIKGMIATNYDAALARNTWKAVQVLALKQGQYLLATRAGGEQGIAAFIMGDEATAKKEVIRAWLLAKAERDKAATVRYASLFGAGLVQMHRYKEALTPLNEAIQLAHLSPSVAFPTIAMNAKIDALAGLHQYSEALQLANESLRRLQGTPFDGSKSQVYISRGDIKREQGDLSAAAADFVHAISISKQIVNYRGIVDAGGMLARTYEQQGKLPDALLSIDDAVEANTHIPFELYLVPRNLAIKAELEDKLSHPQAAEALYRKSITLVDGMIQHAPAPTVQRKLLAEMSDVYSGYFAFLCAQKRYNDALQVLDNVRGRIETEALQHHEYKQVHEATPEERELTRLNVSLINTDDSATRRKLSDMVYTAELAMTSDTLAQQTMMHPVNLSNLQKALGPNELLIEYVLAEPNSYAFAITRDSVSPYQLPPKATIEADAAMYRKEIRSRKEDKELAHRLFAELLEPITAYASKTDLVVIPDGGLHLLPFAALMDGTDYLLKSHTIDVNPSSTVYSLIHSRLQEERTAVMPYIGVAAWAPQTADEVNSVTMAIKRAVSGPERSELVPLPDSKAEVEAIAADLPKPSTILEGSEATEGHFKALPLDSTDVIHLALHGYVDLDYPDRSALVFAPEISGSEDGLLQVREIRNLHLKAKLVTLSACDTGVGPIGETGVENIVNAFIEAGADSVVSTLWEVEDHSTERLMTDFYSQLAAHKRKVDALRSAQLDLLREGLPPYYWASFQMVGDPNGNV